MSSEFFYRNLWREHTPVASSEHPNFPAVETWGRRPSQGWRSLYGAGSGWGTFTVVVGVNDKIDFQETIGVNKVATLTPGDYSTITLLIEAKTRLDAAGASTYTPAYAETGANKNKFSLASDGGGGGGVFRLLWQSGPNAAHSAAGLFGYSTAADDTGALTYLADYARIHTQETLVEDFGAALDIDGVMLAGHNLQAGATCRAEFSTNNFATISLAKSFVIQAGVMGIIFAPHAPYQYGRLWISDPTNPAGFVRVAVPFWCYGLRPARGYRRGRTRQLKDASLILSSDNENKTSVQRDRYWPRTWGFNGVKASDQLLFKAFADYVGLSRDFFFVEDIAHVKDTMHYLQLSSYAEQFFSGGAEGIFWDISLAADELI